MVLKDYGIKLEDFTEEYQAKLNYIKAYEKGHTYIFGNQTFDDSSDLAGCIYFSDLEDYAVDSCGLVEQMEIILDYIEDFYSLDFLLLFDKDLPFPYPELKKGDLGAIQYFHKSIYEATKLGKKSPLEGWKDKELIFKSAINRLRYVGRCTPKDILQGFSVAGIAPKISVFKPAKATQLLNKYLKDVKEIFDPFSGFSGRLIGTCRAGKTYIGQDIHPGHIAESNQIAEYLELKNYTLKVQDILVDEGGEYEALFTCPPYGGKEHWNKNNDEIEKTCDEWIDICLEKYKCKKYLIVVDETEKYKDYIVDQIQNKSHFGTNFEKVLLIEK